MKAARGRALGVRGMTRDTRRRRLTRLLGLVPVLMIGGLLAGCHPAAAPGGRITDITALFGLVLYEQVVDGTNSTLTVTQDGDGVIFRDLGGLVVGGGPGDGCVQLKPHRVRCEAAPGDQLTLLALAMGDGNDRVQNLTSIASQTDGGPGDDHLTGGSGNDVMQGNAGNDRLEGGNGNDTLDDATEELDADTYIGGGGTDAILYGANMAFGVVVTLNDLADDGRAGEGDNVMSDVEDIFGSQANDTLTGNDAANAIGGGAGDDVMSGGGGDDTLNGSFGFDTIDGGVDNDTCELGGPPPDDGIAFNCETVSGG